MTTAMSARERCRCLPAGGQISVRPMRDGWPLRTIHWPGRADGPGSILFLNGRGDFIEKYAETFHDLVGAGWGVASFDWRGQGLSGRLGDDPVNGHGRGFEACLGDLDELVSWFQTIAAGPWYAMGHSMGGHLLLRHLAGQTPIFRRAVLLSPMLGVLARPVGARWSRRLARAMVKAGQGGRYVLGGGPYRAGIGGSARQTLLTSDPDRYGDEAWWIAQTPALALGSVTWGWLDAAFQSLDDLLLPPPSGADRRPAIERIATPTLTMIPEIDGLVDNRVTRRVQARPPLASISVIPVSGHELLRENAATRTAVLAQALDFLQA